MQTLRSEHPLPYHFEHPKKPYRRITEGQDTEQFLASLKPDEVFEHPETLRLMVMTEKQVAVRFPYD